MEISNLTAKYDQQKFQSLMFSALRGNQGIQEPDKYYNNIRPNSRGITLKYYERVNKNFKKEGYVKNLTATKAMIDMIYDEETGFKYTPMQIDAHENRFYFDSFDWQRTKKDKIYVNELASFMKLVSMIETQPCDDNQHKGFKGLYYTAIIFANIGTVQYSVRSYKRGLIVERHNLDFETIEAYGQRNTVLVHCDTPRTVKGEQRQWLIRSTNKYSI